MRLENVCGHRFEGPLIVYDHIQVDIHTVPTLAHYTIRIRNTDEIPTE
jgi:hypothetical protein